MKKLILILSAVLFSFSLNQTAFAHMNKKACPDCMAKMVKQLNLTQEQQNKLKSIKENFKQKQKTNYEQLKNLRSQMHEIVKSEQIDESKLDQLVKQRNEVTGSMFKNKVMMKHEAYSVLNPEQQKKFDTMLEEKMKKMQDKYQSGSDAMDDESVTVEEESVTLSN